MIVVTATDTQETVALEGAITEARLHEIATAWIDPLSPVAQCVRHHLGSRHRARSYCIDQTNGKVAIIRFSPFKRPEPLMFRGKPTSFVWDQLSPFTLEVREVVFVDP